MSAAQELTRIVQLVAELSRAAREDEDAPTLGALAASFGVSPSQIATDLRTLTLLGDHADADWLLSLRVWQQRDRVSVSSAGPFRRPVRLSPEESLALQSALLLEGELDLAARFAAEPEGEDWGSGRHPASASAAREPLPAPLPAERVAQACAQGRRVRIRYASEGKAVPSEWTLEVHQLVEHAGYTYLVAWCVEAEEWRRFRDDRVLEATPLDQAFKPREDFEPVRDPGGVFRAPAEPERATIRFGPRVARWLRERYPEHESGPDGSILVRVPVANPHWLVRRVLEYGPDAEVLEPVHYREAMRQAVG